MRLVVLAVGILTLAAAAAYVIGSMSPSYVAARGLGGIDLRLYGSGTVSGSNVWRSVARWAVVPVGIVEVLKGVGAVLVARALGLDVWWQMMAGCIVIVGHNWSMFLRFSGGRGFGVSIGVLLMVGPKELAVMGGITLLGFLAGASAPAMGLGMAATPVVSYLFGDRAAVTAGCGILTFLMFAKRLTGDPSAGKIGPGLEEPDPEPPCLRPRHQRRARLAGTEAALAGCCAAGLAPCCRLTLDPQGCVGAPKRIRFWAGR